MSTIRHYFTAMHSSIEPSEERAELCKALPGEVREWLKDHDFETSAPHTRLSGSYARKTAIRFEDQDINDVDVLLFLPVENLESTPSTVIGNVKKALEDYPDTTVETRTQRRSVRLDFPLHGLFLDIVPAVAEGGTDEPLKIPNRQQGEWIESDPLGYGRSLSALNQEKGGKVVPLVKGMKAWRDEHTKIRKPKSYVLEVMVYQAIEGEKVEVVDRGWHLIYADLFGHLWTKYSDLFENGDGVPRVKDPQLGHLITKGWERSHFETFMRRIQESQKASEKAIECMDASDEDGARKEWVKVFGSLWPEEEEAKSAALLEARLIQPGSATVTSTGLVTGGGGTKSRRTSYYGRS